mgnify:CR=1 FL=1
MKIGYSTWSTKQTPVEDAIRELGRIGFDCVEIDLTGGGTSSLDALDPARRRLIRRLLDAAGLELSGLVSAHRNQIGDDAEHDAGRDSYRRELDLALEWAAGAKIPVMDVAIGGRADDWEQLKGRIVEAVGETVRVSADRGVTVALEPHCGQAVNTPDRMLWVLEQVASPYCRVNFDISHFNVIGIPIEQSVGAMAPYTVHTHVKDERGRYPAHEFLIPGEGEFDYARYLRAMQASGYTGDVTCEISVMVQRRPNYDAVAAMEQTYRVLSAAFSDAGVARG